MSTRFADLHSFIEQLQRDGDLAVIDAPVEARLEVAEIHRSQGRPQRALAALSTLRETYPDGEVPAETLYLSGLAMAALDRPADAIDAYLAAADRGMAGANFLASLAEARLQMGDLEAARVQRFDVGSSL